MAKKKKKKFSQEFKKTLRKSGKNKSNKLIYAVAAGLGLILIVAFILTISGDKKPRDKEKLMLDAIHYLVKNANIKNLKVIPEENKVVMMFDVETIAGSKKNIDFRKIARYAGVRISHELKDEEIKVLLSEIKKKEKDYLIIIKNGTVISEQVSE